MNFLPHLLFVLTLSLGLTPSLLSARQIRQPDSILPWRAPQPESRLTLSDTVADNSSDSPTWLLETAERSSDRADLPMVETESFADLGPLHPGSGTTQTRSAQRNRTGNSVPSPPFNLFRALGIQATRPGNRR